MHRVEIIAELGPMFAGVINVARYGRSTTRQIPIISQKLRLGSPNREGHPPHAAETGDRRV
ncbi:protein of unknown function [Paraburkholderia dioscoreae]|uniref:Uncharacterized protein n=1 Tax=Paraburkholderia dioscoreae TaxID=2604047 RepID=A0A5Q4ZAX9_9BURK|nr:protein of unknown function [Paraburkholderia dioscoreae]